MNPSHAPFCVNFNLLFATNNIKKLLYCKRQKLCEIKIFQFNGICHNAVGKTFTVLLPFIFFLTKIISMEKFVIHQKSVKVFFHVTFVVYGN